MITSIATKYARALADVAGESQNEREVLEELQTFRDLLVEHEELHDALTSPAIPFSSKRKIVEGLQELLQLSRPVVNFLLVILENNRMKKFVDFVQAYEEVVDQRSGVVKVDVYSPRVLDPSIQERLGQTISNLTGSQVKLNYSVDEALIGGLKLRVGSQVFDGSIQTQLEQIRRQLSQ